MCKKGSPSGIRSHDPLLPLPKMTPPGQTNANIFAVHICRDHNRQIFFFLKIIYHTIPWLDSISRPIAPVASVAGDTFH
jgi:hypothetical protein